MFRLFRLTRRAVLIVLIVALAATSACFVNAGRMLVAPGATEMPAPADAIVVLSGSPADRWLEGYDLWREGRAPIVVLSRGLAYDSAMRELQRRGVRFPVDYELAIDMMTRGLGMPREAIQVMPQPVDNTAGEATMTRNEAQRNGWKRVIVVTSLAHTRRTALAMRRVLTPAGIDFHVRATRYDQFQPSGWWRSRNSMRWILSEIPKLVAYRLGLRD
jgi:uncharacterized SAM-binding protein YcdF (DUF218 family)